MTMKLLRQAFQLHQKGELEEAKGLYAKVLAAQPRNLDALRLSGIAHAQAADFDQAAAFFSKALRQQPASMELLFNLGKVLVDGGRGDEALDILKKARQLKPKNPDVLLYLSLAHTADEDRLAALARAQEAADLAPKRPDIIGRLASALVDVDKFEPAISTAQHALAIKGDLHMAWAVISRAHKGLLRLEDAERAARMAISLAPDIADYQADLAEILVELGRFDDATVILQEIIERFPRYTGSYARLASINKLPPDSEAFSKTLKLANDESFSSAQRSRAAFAAATVFDREGRFDEAFHYFKQSCELRKRKPLEPEKVESKVRGILQAFSKDRLAALGQAVEADPLPVFVIGMPRSGTTLTEKILSAHPEIVGAGELHLVANLSRKISEDSGEPYPGCLQGVEESVLISAAEVALSRLRAFDPAARRVVDKMPGNFYFLGLIAILFPGATILHLNRHPLDVALSCYQANFGAINWSYSFEGLALELHSHKRLMEHWRSVMPDRIFEISYEELVSNPSEEAQRIIDATGLEWDEACLRPEEQQGFVRTASSYQARQAINTSSIGRWRNYEKHLEPLRLMLERNGVLEPEGT